MLTVAWLGEGLVLVFGLYGEVLSLYLEGEA